MKLLGLNFKICYKQGVENRAADALSRVPPGPHQEVLAISTLQAIWLQELVDAYPSNPQTAKLLTTLAVQTISSHFSLQDGVIKYKGRVWVGHSPSIQLKILQSLHSAPLGGHSGFPVTYKRVKELFAWPGMKSMVKTFVSECTICQQAKTERVKYPSLLQPLDVPKFAWQVVSLDFIEGLPSSQKYDCILVIVDKFSKFAHFIPLKHPFTAFTVALAFMDNIFKLHGLPEAIISDRDRIFTSSLWQELFKMTQTKLKMGIAYHPQTDGQTERVNQCLEGYLRCFVHACPNQWKKWLALAEFWYNTSFYTSLDSIPFEILYGQKPCHLGIDVIQSCAVPDVKMWLQDRSTMVQLLQQQLVRAQQRQKQQADKLRTEWSFGVGDSVYLKLQPYVQTSVATRANHKLSFRYFGPYQVIAKVGSVAYKLLLPDNTTIHSVFHVS